MVGRRIPLSLPDKPFRGSHAIMAGKISRRQLGGTRVRRLLPDVYLSASLSLDHFTWCEAAALLLPASAAIGGWSALSIYCPDVCPSDEDPVDVEVPPPHLIRAHPRLRIHRGRLNAGDVRRFGQLPVTTPVRTAFDLARRSPLVEAVIGLDTLLLNGTITPATLSSYVNANVSLHHAHRVQESLALARPGAQSPMETRTRLVLVLAGLPEPVLQHEVVNSTGRVVGRLDLAYPERKIGIEYEGDHHRERAQFQKDLARINRLRMAGWTILRFSADDILRNPQGVVAQVRHALGL